MWSKLSSLADNALEKASEYTQEVFAELNEDLEPEIIDEKDEEIAQLKKQLKEYEDELERIHTKKADISLNDTDTLLTSSSKSNEDELFQMEQLY